MSDAILYKHPPKEGRCCKAVSNGARMMSWHQCYRKAVVTRGEVGYCKTHDPVARAERLKAEIEEDRRRWAVHEQRMDVEAAAPDLLKACETALKWFETGDRDLSTFDIQKELEAAIKKARP